MYDVAIKLKSSNHMVEALCLSHYLLANSPNNFHAKLLCMQLYHRIGCPYGAHKMYKSLNLKFIQLHSMAYLHCARLATSGLYTIAGEVFNATTTFFQNYLHEGHEFIAMCYKFGSFSKLEEFMEFREKLLNSFHCLLTSNDTIIMALVGYQPSSSRSLNETCLNTLGDWRSTIDAKYFGHWDFLSDNRDLSVIARWDPIDKETEKQQNDEILRQDLAMARIRFEIPYMMLYCSEIMAKIVRPDVEKCLKRWPKLFAEIRAANYKVTSDEYLVNQLPSRLHGLLEMPYEGILQNIIDLIKSLEHRFTEPIDNIRQRLEQYFKDMDELCCKQIDENNTCEDRLWNRRYLQDTVAMGAELFSIATFMLAIVHEKYVMSAAKKGVKRNKKKTTNDTDPIDPSICVPSEPERITAIISILNQLKISITSFDAAVGKLQFIVVCNDLILTVDCVSFLSSFFSESWKVPVLPKSLSEVLASLSLNPKVATLAETYANIKDNHELTIQEIRANLANKIITLNNITKNSA